MHDAITTEAPSARVPAPVWVLLALGAYFAVMTLQAALLAPSGRSDDTETLLLSQSLAWGYEAKNPPAFYWLAWWATTLLGPSLPVIYALRLAGVFAGFAGLYAIARRVQPDPLLAASAGLAMLATLHFHWYLLFYLTNTSFALALAPLAVLALLRLRERRAGAPTRSSARSSGSASSPATTSLSSPPRCCRGARPPAWRAPAPAPRRSSRSASPC